MAEEADVWSDTDEFLPPAVVQREDVLSDVDEFRPPALVQREDVFDRRFPDEEEAEEWSEQIHAATVVTRCEARRRERNFDYQCPVWNMKTQEQWEEAIKGSFNRNGDEATHAFNAFKKAAAATCLVRRVQGNMKRKRFHEAHVLKPSLDEATRRLHRQLGIRYNGGGQGTGVLWSSNPPLVITNNHVIMDESEAATAKVYFDYDKDEQRNGNTIEGARVFEVKDIVTSSLRTEREGNATTLDFTVLELRHEPSDTQFLQDHALDSQFGGGKWLLAGDSVPIVMVGHPHGLAKRLSLGRVPTREPFPFSHVRHNLASCAGSSSGNLFFISGIEGQNNYEKWMSAFVHYRGSRAVDSESISDAVDKELESRGQRNEALVAKLQEFIAEVNRCEEKNEMVPQDFHEVCRRARQAVAVHVLDIAQRRHDNLLSQS